MSWQYLDLHPVYRFYCYGSATNHKTVKLNPLYKFCATQYVVVSVYIYISDMTKQELLNSVVDKSLINVALCYIRMSNLLSQYT